jgi:hypothetical protein
MKLMYDNIVVAEQHVGNDGLHLKLLEGVEVFFIPEGLFDPKTKSVSIIDLIGWIEGRIFPKDRMGADKLLAQLGLNDYSPFSIAKQNKACLIEDGWWLSFDDKDTFRESTIRGAAGFPEWIDPEPKLSTSSIFSK